MNKIISPPIRPTKVSSKFRRANGAGKITALVFGVLVISFAIAFYAVAWQEPSQAPPEGNVSAPLNVGSDPQEKEGPLTLNTICIGQECRDSWPMNTIYRLEASGYQVEDEYFSDSSSYICPDGGNVVNVSLSTNNVTVQGPMGGGCIWGCQAGDCSPSQQNSCSYSISDSTVTLKASVVENYEPDCACCTGLSLVDYCYPHTGRWGFNQWTCYIPSGNPQCSVEFQCATKQTVGE